MSKSYKNKVELKDGQIILFHRQGAKRPIWHMRIQVPGMRDVDGSKLTYVQETTGETDLDEAKRTGSSYNSLDTNSIPEFGADEVREQVGFFTVTRKKSKPS